MQVNEFADLSKPPTGGFNPNGARGTSGQRGGKDYMTNGNMAKKD